MMRVVVDTNIFVSGSISKKGTPAQILALWRNNHFSLVSSPALIGEIKRVFNYPHIKRIIESEDSDIELLILEIKHTSIMTPGKLKLKIVKDDPTDDRFFECAVEGKAKYIISGDHHLLAVEEYQGIKIICPTDFIKKIN